MTEITIRLTSVNDVKNFVSAVTFCSCDVDIAADRYIIDAKSIMGIFSLCTVNGEDYPSAVNYWIPFDGNLGISDAPWRMDFGGQLYEFEGTHGSICAPSDQVQIIFSNVEKNTPIVIYE